MDADISAVTARAPDIMHFFVIRDHCPPPAAAGYQTDGCALEFFIHASYNRPVGHMTTSHDLGSGSKCGGV